MTTTATEPASQRDVMASKSDYEAVWLCSDDSDWLARVHEQLWMWLRERKSIDLDVTQEHAGFRSERGDQEFTVANHATPGTRMMRAELVERTGATGTWTTELIGVERTGGDGWISLVVRNDRGRYVKVPNLARHLLEVLPLTDGALVPQATATVVRHTDVDDLVRSILDQDRQGLVFVAGTAPEGLPFDPFVDQVTRWTRDVVGLAQVVVLDPVATRTLAERLAPLHVPDWTIRTYFPGVDPDEPSEIHRHRILGTSALAQLEEGRIQRLLGTVARGHTHGRESSAEVIRTRRLFQRLRNRQLLEAVGAGATTFAPAPTVEPTPEAAATLPPTAELITLVRDILGVAEVTEDSLRSIREQLDRRTAATEAVQELEARIEAIQTLADEREDEIAHLHRALDDALLESGIADEENGRLQDEARWLRARLREAEDHEGAHSQVPDEARTKYPAGYVDLIAQIRSLERQGIILTADEDLILNLADHDQMGTCLQNIWDGVLMLADYKRAAEAGDATKGLAHYIKNPPAGYRTIAPGKFAARESESTMNQYGDLRIFPVPEIVDPGGRAVMEPHLKLGRIGIITPRLHFIDDLANSGRIVIGYIGPHLRNPQTN